MSHHQFGSGTLVGMTLVGGVLVPRRFGALQDVSFDVSFAKKKLFGQSQFALVIARGQGSITGKAKFANIDGKMFNDLFFGLANVTGQKVPVYAESSVIPTTPFQITAVNAATYVDDMGVTDVTAGIVMTRVPSAPTTGQYSVTAAGVYTFAAADVGHTVTLDYTYTVVGGNTTAITNQLAGTTPNFKVVFPLKSAASPGNVTKSLSFTLNYCVAEKLSLATKIEDFVIPEFDFEAAADASGAIGSFAESGG